MNFAIYANLAKMMGSGDGGLHGVMRDVPTMPSKLVGDMISETEGWEQVWFLYDSRTGEIQYHTRYNPRARGYEPNHIRNFEKYNIGHFVVSYKKRVNFRDRWPKVEDSFTMKINRTKFEKGKGSEFARQNLEESIRLFNLVASGK